MNQIELIKIIRGLSIEEMNLWVKLQRYSIEPKYLTNYNSLEQVIIQSLVKRQLVHIRKGIVVPRVIWNKKQEKSSKLNVNLSSNKSIRLS